MLGIGTPDVESQKTAFYIAMILHYITFHDRASRREIVGALPAK